MFTERNSPARFTAWFARWPDAFPFAVSLSLYFNDETQQERLPCAADRHVAGRRTHLLRWASDAAATLPAISVKAAAEHASYDGGRSRAATKTDMSLMDVPQTVNVVPHAVIEDQNATSMQDALRNVPGVGFSVGDGQRDQITIRGFNSITDQYVDGIRDDALYYRDLSNVDHVEVLKGPAAVLYGRGSAGGIVNRVLKRPDANPVRDVGVTLGTRGERRGEFDLGWNASDAARFRITGAAENSNSFRDQFQLNRQAIAPSAQFKLDRDTVLNVEFDYLHDRRTSDQGCPRISAGRSTCRSTRSTARPTRRTARTTMSPRRARRCRSIIASTIRCRSMARSARTTSRSNARTT